MLIQNSIDTLNNANQASNRMDIPTVNKYSNLDKRLVKISSSSFGTA